MRRQTGYVMDDRIHAWIKENYQRAGFRNKSNFLESIVKNAMKNEYHQFSSKKVEDELAIGDIATRRRATKFSVIRAQKDLEEDRKGLREALEGGLITREDYEDELAETEADHKEVVKLYMRSKKIEKARNKLKEQGYKFRS